MVAEAAAEIRARRVQTPDDVLDHVKQYRAATQEHFLVLTLDGAHQVINTHVVTKGLVNRTVVHCREVYRAAILDNAVAIICVHNHPSGNLVPSDEDNGVTKSVKAAGEVVGIKMLDHVIIAAGGEYSYLEAGRV